MSSATLSKRGWPILELVQGDDTCRLWDEEIVLDVPCFGLHRVHGDHGGRGTAEHLTLLHPVARERLVVGRRTPLKDGMSFCGV